MTRPTTKKGFDRLAMLHRPVEELEHIRLAGGIVWSETQLIWMVSDHQITMEALRNRSLAVLDALAVTHSLAEKSGVDFSGLSSVTPWIPFTLEGSDHKSKRKLVARFLSDIRPDYLKIYRGVSAELLSGMVKDDGADFVTHYAYRVHVMTMAKLVGFDQDSALWFAHNLSSDGLADFVFRLAEVIEANTRIGAAVSRLTDILERESCKEFVSRMDDLLVSENYEPDIHNRVHLLFALLLLGRDTIGGSVAVGLHLFLEEKNGTITSADWLPTKAMVNEFIRRSSAVQMVFRVATEDTSLGGQLIKKDEKAVLYLVGSNHDPAVFQCPHSFSADRSTHLAFGSARHLCSGMPMAKDALAITIGQLMDFAVVQALPGAEYHAGNRLHRKMKSLPLKLG